MNGRRSVNWARVLVRGLTEELSPHIPMGGIISHKETSMQTVNLRISGMGCGACVSKVTTALKGLSGVTVEHVAVGSARATIDSSKASPKQLVDALAGVGFEAHQTDGSAAPQTR
jgi:copper chaperone